MTERALRDVMKRAIQERFGLAFSASRTSTLERGIERAAAALAGGSMPMLLARLQGRDPDALGALADELTISETYFFRDAGSFVLIDEAVERALAESRTLRLWSAGCATGEEAYSLAIRALIARGDTLLPIEIVGTDVSPRAIAAAERALYRPWSFRGVPDELRERWFEELPAGFRPIRAVRDLVRFRVQNLLEPEGAPSYVDVAFCRNVFIYLDPVATARAVDSLIAALNPTGALVLGPSDPLVQDSRVRIDQSGGFVSYRREEQPPESVRTPRAHEKRATLEPSSAPLQRSNRPREPGRFPTQIPRPRDSTTPPSAEDREMRERAARARTLADRGDLEGALALLRGAEDDAALLVRAFVAQGLGDYGSALRDARALAARENPLPLAHVVEALALVEMGDVTRAREAMNRAHAALSTVPPNADVGNGALASDALATLSALKHRLGARARRRTRES